MSKNKNTTWVLVADAARARLFCLDSRERILSAKWEHEIIGSNLPSQAIASDRPGRTFDSGGEGRHAMEPPTDPARYEKERFAREVIRKLEDERKRQAFDRLIIVAPPQFLGDLRAAMSASLQACVSAEINKDISKLKPAEIYEHIEGALGR